MEVGISPEGFVTRYIQNESAVYVATGCTMSPPIFSIFLRGNWIIDGVKDSHIKYEREGDQFLVRL